MRIDDVQLTSPDPQAYAAELARLLELPPTPACSPGVGASAVTDGMIRIGCGASTITVVPGPTGPGVHHLAFSVPNASFDAARERLADRVTLLQVGGSDVFTGPGHWNSRSVYFGGPDDSILELIARAPLADADLLASAGATRLEDLPASGAAALSEVGVASHDLAALRDTLARVGLHAFGTPAPDFSPVGDHDGLLILVADRRAWWPQDSLVSGGGPLQVSLAAAQGTALLTVDDDLEATVEMFRAPPG